MALAVASCAGPRPSDAGLDAYDAGPDARADSGGDAGAIDTIAVLTLNLHCLDTSGTPYATNDARFAAIADLVASERVDAIALQEVCDDGALDALDALRTAIEARTGARWSRAYAFAHRAWEGTEREADEGLAILARGELRASHEIAYVAQGGLRRVALLAPLSLEAGAITLASVHLDHRDAAVREAQARETAAGSLALSDPSLDVVLAGDFNARALDAALAQTRAAGFVDASSALSPDRIDHVVVHRGASVAPISASLVLDAPSERVSDHPGVLVRFEPRAPSTVTVTRIVASVALAPDEHLAIRGSIAPLAWDRGWPMTNVGSRWRFVTAEIQAPFEMKTLIDDVRWQAGANVSVTPGTTVELAPSYE